MNRSQKRALAWALLGSANNLIENWDKHTELNIHLKDVKPEDAAKAIGKWMKPLPVEERPKFIPKKEEV